MRRKLAGQEGLTLVEVLAAVVILVLLGLILNAGMQMAVNSYRVMIAQSETELLLSTLADTLADDLRYAEDVVASGGKLDSYYSDSYGEDTTLELNNTENDPNKGKVYANSGGKKLRVLPDGAYGLNGRYEVEQMDITYEKGCFTLKLKVKEKDSTIHAETELTVRCLNAKKEEETGG